MALVRLCVKQNVFLTPGEQDWLAVTSLQCYSSSLLSCLITHLIKKLLVIWILHLVILQFRLYFHELCSPNIYLFVSKATLLLDCHRTNWVRDAAASAARTPRTNPLTAVSRESQVLQVSPHSQEAYYYLSLWAAHSTVTCLHFLQL